MRPLHGAGEHDVAEMAESLVTRLLNASPPLLLIIDDYEMVTTDLAAESLLGLVLRSGAARSIVASRARPAWMTSRLVAYGEVEHIETRDLAMTKSEAQDIFASVGKSLTPEASSLADGWPAVLALMAISESSAPVLSETLEDFLAEEVCTAMTPPLKAALLILSSFTTIDVGVAGSLLGASIVSERLLDEAVDAGVADRIGSNRFQLHPLIREHLRKAPLDQSAVVSIEHGGRALATNGNWDEMFELAERVVSEGLLTELLTQGVRSALDEGRSSSVRRWIDFGRLHRISKPSVSLAEAELALRDGLYAQSEIRALEVAQCAVSHPGVKSWALLVAGRSAHLAGREREALGYYREARVHAQTDFERREAQWGELKSAIDLEIPEATDLLLKGQE